MHDFTISIGSSSKTFAYASARLGFAACGNSSLLADIGEWLRQTGDYHISPPLEISTAAALALTPRDWINRNNQQYSGRLSQSKVIVREINERNNSTIEINNPLGGWYILLCFSRSEIPTEIRDLIATCDELHSYLLYYGKLPNRDAFEADSGVITFPGSVTGLLGGLNGDAEQMILRVSLALPNQVFEEVFRRIELAWLKLRTMPRWQLQEILKYANEHVQHSEYRLPLGSSSSLGSDGTFGT